MQTGRPSNKVRPPFGKRIHTLREDAGLSQREVAEQLGIPQRTYAYWERNPVALRDDQYHALAEVLGTTASALLGESKQQKRGTGPSGKMRRLFDEASRLPRSQQNKIIEIVEMMLNSHRQNKR